MPASDRLARLAALRYLLRRSGYATLDAYLSTANHPELGADAPDIAHLVAAGDPDVLAALFGPVDWSADGDDGDPGARSMTIRWDAGDPDGERLAWVALRAVLRARRSGRLSEEPRSVSRPHVFGMPWSATAGRRWRWPGLAARAACGTPPADSPP